MQNQDNFTNTDNAAPSLISLTDFLFTMWHGRWLSLLIIVLVTGFGLALTFSRATYESQGFFQFGGSIPMKEREKEKDKEKEKETSPGILLADYKRYAASYATSERFADFIREKKLEAAKGINGLYGVFMSRGSITKLIDPIYPFTKLDAKELMEQPKESGNKVIGLRISYAADSPEVAQQMVGLLGRYAMDSIVYSIYSDKLRAKQDEMRNKIAEYDNIVISNKLMLEELRQKAEDLKQIIARNPAAAKETTRQVVTVAEDTARYLPPITQLVTAEVQTSEVNQIILKAKREQKQKMVLLEYYDRAKVMLDSTKSGESILRGLESVKEQVFKNKDLQDDSIKEIYNSITADNMTALNLYLERSRFIAGPTLPQRSTARPVLTIAISILVGFLLSIIFIFGRKWLRDNKNQVSS